MSLLEGQVCPITGYTCRQCPRGRCNDADADPMTPTFPNDATLSRLREGQRTITVIDLGTGEEMGDILVPAPTRKRASPLQVQ